MGAAVENTVFGRSRSGGLIALRGLSGLGAYEGNEQLSEETRTVHNIARGVDSQGLPIADWRDQANWEAYVTNNVGGLRKDWNEPDLAVDDYLTGYKQTLLEIQAGLGQPSFGGEWFPEWNEPFKRNILAAKKAREMKRILLIGGIVAGVGAAAFAAWLFLG